MASRKNLVLASLVSLVMVLSFGIGLVPMLTVGSGQGAKAAPGASLVAISVDGATPVGSSYAVPVGSEQGFSALWLAGDVAQPLAGGEIEWSLATDGAAELVSDVRDAVATVRAVAPGSAGLYVRTADGQVSVVDLTFYDMKAAKSAKVNAITVTSPEDGGRVLIPATATGALVTLTARPDVADDISAVYYLLDGAEAGYSVDEPYPVAVADLSVGFHSVAASALRISDETYVDSASVDFEVAQAGTDADNDGLPDDPFGLNLLEGDIWSLDTTGGDFDRQAALTLLGGGEILKQVAIPTEGTTLTIADPADSTRWVSVTVPDGLIQPEQNALLVLTAADTLGGLLGATEAGELPSPLPAEAVANGRFANVNIIIEDNGSWVNLDEALLADNPITVQMGGLGVTANESAAFFVHPTTLIEGATGPEVSVTAASDWARPDSGAEVLDGALVSELTTLGVLYPAALPNSPNIGVDFENISSGQLAGTASAFSIGGQQVVFTVTNLLDTDQLGVQIDGQEATVANRDGATVTVTVPEAAALLAPAETALVDVRVDIQRDTESDFDVLPDAFTYVGPRIAAVSGTASAGSEIVIGGEGFQSAPGTTVLWGDALLTVTDASETSITARVGNQIPAGGTAAITVINANNYSGTSQASVQVTAGVPVLDDVQPELIYNDAEYELNLTGTGFIPAYKALYTGALVYLSDDETASPDTDTAAVTVSVIDSTLIVAEAPSGLAPGVYNVYVATLTYDQQTGGDAQVVTSNTKPVEVFDSEDALLSITAIAPGIGPIEGGTQVTITGDNLFPDWPDLDPFEAAALVTANDSYRMYDVFFGANEATYVSMSPTEIVVVTPPGVQAGPVDVRVENPFEAGAYIAIAVDGFTYTVPELIVSPPDPFNAIGPQGGPFVPDSATFTLSNANEGDMSWTAQASEDWLSLSAASGTILDGETGEVIVSINSAVADGLAVGVYTATVTFDDGNATTPLITIPVQLTVELAGQDILGVSPAGGISSNGPTGGPFDFTSADFVVTNAGDGTLHWTAADDADWLDLSLTSGTLTAGNSETVTATLNANALALGAGTHVATIVFDDDDAQAAPVTRTFTLIVREPLPPQLRVEPQEGLAATGPEGGPFAPQSQNYSVFNDGDLPLTWDASLTFGTGDPEWATLTQDGDDIGVTIDQTVAATLDGSPTGAIYTATLTVDGNGGTATRLIQVTVYAPPTISDVQPRNIAPPTGGMTVYLVGEFADPATPGVTVDHSVFFTMAQGQNAPDASDREALEVVFINTNLLEVVTPVHDEGTFALYVRTDIQTPGGLISQESDLAPFIFAAPALTVSDVDPDAGPLAGGTTVTITGEDFPDVSAVGKAAKQGGATETVLIVENEAYNVYGGSGKVQIDLSLFRGAELPATDGPSSISGSLHYDPAVLQFAAVNTNDQLFTWYRKETVANGVYVGLINFVVAGLNYNEITTFDNQITTTGHDPDHQINPFLLGNIEFNVLASEAIYSPLTVTDLVMVDGTTPTPNNIDGRAENGSVTIGAASAELQLEDVSLAEGDPSFDLQVNLFRPAGSDLTRGPADITFTIDYDELDFVFTGADPSVLLGSWYGKIVTIVSHDAENGLVTIMISDPLVKQGAEITTQNPNPQGEPASQNPFPLTALHFDVRENADLSDVAPFTVTELTMLDKDGLPFAGSAGIGNVATVTVTNLPDVYFGRNQGDTLSSTPTTIGAVTPAGDRRSAVDVLVVDPSMEGPSNYGILLDGFTYELPELQVLPDEPFTASGTVGGTVFTPASKAYTVYNIGNGTLNWTAVADATWVTVAPAGGAAGEGESEEVVVSIDGAAASALPVGTHTATVTFDDGDPETEPVTREVTLTITGEANLRIEPQTELRFIAVVGGTVNPVSRSFFVYNDGASAMTWAATADAAWVYLTPENGTVNAASSQEIQVTVDATGLEIGFHTADVTFTAGSETEVRQVTVVVVPEGEPAVIVQEAENLVSSGPQGGPFDPVSTSYTVYNAGGGLAPYTVTVDATWIDLTNATGEVIGGQTAAIAVSIDATEAAQLPASATPYVATLTFDDGDTETPVETRTVTLNVFTLAVTAPNGGEEFERDEDLVVQWTYTGPADIAQQVRIELLLDGEVAQTLTDATANAAGNNTFTWAIPDDVALDRGYAIRITSTTNDAVTDESDDTFAIIEPEFEIVNPAPGEQVNLVGNDPEINVQWNYYEIGQPVTKANEFVNIYLYEGDQQVAVIGTNVPNPPFDQSGTNSLLWDVPANIGSGNNYRIVITTPDGQTVLAETPMNQPFRIVRSGGPQVGALALLLAGLGAAALGLASGGGDGGGGGPCFIATAAYGTPLADQIDTLRQFRDMYLLSNPFGMAVADAYYHVSPAIADLVAKSPLLATVVRLILLPVIVAAKVAVSMPAVSMAVMMLSAALYALRRRSRRTKA